MSAGTQGAQLARNVPQLIAQPMGFPVGGSLMAAVVLSPYGGAGQAEIEKFSAYASLTPLTGEAPGAGPWSFWRTGKTVVVAFNKPGQPGAVHVVMELDDPPAVWWGLAQHRAQVAVVWLPDARHPTAQEVLDALNARSGWMASARRVPAVELL